MRAGGLDAGIVNPYEYQRPVETREEFAGRHEILSKIEYALALAKAERPQYRNFAITGPRGIGKTSLVNVLVQMASEVHGLMAARTTLYNDTVEDHAKLFEDVLESILAEERIVQPSLWMKLTRAWRSTSVQVEVKLAIATLKAARQQGAQFPQKKLRDGLQEIYRRVLNAGTKAIVVCLDEADLLTKNETAVQSLRSVFEAQRGYILVLSGTDTLLDRLGATFGPIQRFFDHIELGPFDKPDEVYAALCNPLPPSEHSIVDMPFATEVFKMTAGHPFQVKLMAYHAYKEMRERNRSRMRLSPEIVDAVLEAAQTTGFPDLSERLDKRRNDPFESDEAAVASVNLRIEEEIEAYESSLTDAPVVKLVNQMLLDASNRGATDIEIVPQQKSTNVRMRVDGVLQPLAEFPSRLHTSLLARLKIIANLDIAERRLPQDGRAAFKLGEKRLEIVLRTLPSLDGESAFIHFRTTEVLELDALGLDDASLDALLAATSRRGVTILAGPNDSGRTTLAHALLLRRRGPNASLATIERSPATRLDGVTQYRANGRIGLSERAHRAARADERRVAVRRERDGRAGDVRIDLSGRSRGDDVPRADQRTTGRHRSAEPRDRADASAARGARHLRCRRASSRAQAVHAMQGNRLRCVQRRRVSRARARDQRDHAGRETARRARGTEAGPGAAGDRGGGRIQNARRGGDGEGRGRHHFGRRDRARAVIGSATLQIIPAGTLGLTLRHHP